MSVCCICLLVMGCKDTGPKVVPTQLGTLLKLPARALGVTTSRKKGLLDKTWITHTDRCSLAPKFGGEVPFELTVKRTTAYNGTTMDLVGIELQLTKNPGYVLEIGFQKPWTKKSSGRLVRMDMAGVVRTTARFVFTYQTDRHRGSFGFRVRSDSRLMTDYGKCEYVGESVVRKAK